MWPPRVELDEVRLAALHERRSRNVFAYFATDADQSPAGFRADDRGGVRGAARPRRASLPAASPVNQARPGR